MKKVLASLAMVLLCGVIVACSSPVAAQVVKSEKERITAPQVSAADLARLVAGNSDFAFELYQQLKSGDGNLFYSPYSISLMFAMAYAGAKGETKSQMADALDFAISDEALHSAMDYLSLELAKGTASDQFKLSVVNDIWGQRNYRFLAPFLDTLALNYGAGLRVLDFNKDPEAARQVINGYIYDQTQKLIKDLIPQGSITELTRLVLTNAIYFKAEWQNKFKKEETRNSSFTLLDGSKVSVPMMSQLARWSYAEGNGWQAIELPYLGGRIAMDVILPTDFKAFESALTNTQLNQIMGAMKQANIQLNLPKFTFGNDFSLKQALSALGMPLAFDVLRADFSGITDVESLYIQDAVHKAYVAVDEEGTEAAAAGAIMMGTTSMPKTMAVDHPFIILIRDVQTGTILFLGRVMNPNA
jgi:serpin B